jgi:hypothetical protein
MPEFVSKLGFWATDSLTQWYSTAYRKIWSWTQFRLIMWNQALGLESTYSSSGKRFQRGSSVQRMCLAQTWFHSSCVTIVKFIYTVKKRRRKNVFFDVLNIYFVNHLFQAWEKSVRVHLLQIGQDSEEEEAVSRHD